MDTEPNVADTETMIRKHKNNYIMYLKCLRFKIFFYNLIYSVMQSDGKSFCGNVVLDSFNMRFSDRPKQ